MTSLKWFWNRVHHLFLGSVACCAYIFYLSGLEHRTAKEGYRQLSYSLLETDLIWKTKQSSLVPNVSCGLHWNEDLVYTAGELQTFGANLSSLPANEMAQCFNCKPEITLSLNMFRATLRYRISEKFRIQCTSVTHDQNTLKDGSGKRYMEKERTEWIRGRIGSLRILLKCRFFLYASLLAQKSYQKILLLQCKCIGTAKGEIKGMKSLNILLTEMVTWHSMEYCAERSETVEVYRSWWYYSYISLHL